MYLPAKKTEVQWEMDDRLVALYWEQCNHVIFGLQVAEEHPDLESWCGWERIIHFTALNLV